jgi:hypothetical protein
MIQTVHDMNIQYSRFSSSSYSRNSNMKYHNPYLPLPFTPRTTSASQLHPRGTSSFNFNPLPHSHPRYSINTERRRLLHQYCAGAPVSLAERRRPQRFRESGIRNGVQHWCTWPRDRPIDISNRWNMSTILDSFIHDRRPHSINGYRV